MADDDHVGLLQLEAQAGHKLLPGFVLIPKNDRNPADPSGAHDGGKLFEQALSPALTAIGCFHHGAVEQGPACGHGIVTTKAQNAPFRPLQDQKILVRIVGPICQLAPQALRRHPGRTGGIDMDLVEQSAHRLEIGLTKESDKHCSRPAQDFWPEACFK